jgi:hypothetical protein
MPGSTGPDLNTYIIPEVQLGDTFNYWRDSTNTAIYKLNKLKIYDAVTSASIGATYGTTGAWQAILQPTITSGHTFSAFITLPGGITTTFLFASSGVTLWSNLFVNGGATFASTTSHIGVATFAAGVTVAGTLDVGGIAKFVTGVTVGGRFDVVGDGRFYSGITVGATLDVGGIAKFVGGVTMNGRLDVGGVGRFSGVSVANNLEVGGVAQFVGVTVANTLDVGGVAKFVTGVTVGGSLDVTGVARLNSGLTLSTLTVNGISRFNGSSVSIGTAAPGASLDVTGQLRLRGSSAYSEPSDAAGIIQYEFYNGILTMDSRSTVGTTSIAFRTSNSGTGAERMRVSGAGNVGIGTSTPLAKLDVTDSSAAKSYSTSILDFSSIHLNGSFANTTNSALTFSSGSGGGSAIAFRRDGSYGTYIDFWTNATTNLTTYASTRRMTVSSDGNILIGDQSSVANTLRYLDVYNTSSSGTSNITGSNLRLITRNNADTTTSIVDIVKYRNGSFNLANNDTGNSSVSTNFILNETNIMNLSLTAVSIPLSTTSTSTSTGALTVGGGVGVAGALCVGQGISAGSGIALGTSTLSAPSGSAPMFATRAWGLVTAAGALTSGGNIASSSLASNQFTIKFTTSMPNANYAVVGSAQIIGGNNQTRVFKTLAKSVGGFTAAISGGGDSYQTEDFNFIVIG